MDRRVKERLVGATILVVLVVLIVPELLSGPKRPLPVPQVPSPGATEPLRSVTVDLATKKATATEEATGVSPADEAHGTNPGATAGATESAGRDAGTSPESVAAGSEPAAAAPTPPQAQAAPAQPLDSGAASPRSAQAAAKPEALHQGWSAQLGSFAARVNAEKLERQLRTQGFSPFLSATGSGKSLRYRVRVGPLADRAATEQVIARLQKAGHPARVVAP